MHHNAIEKSLSHFIALTYKSITFGGGTRTVGGNLTHAATVATERYKPGDDGCFAVAHTAHHNGAAVVCRLAGLQDVFQLLKEPIAANEHGVCGDAGHLEQQRLEHDVHRLVGCKAGWRRRETNFTLFMYSTGQCNFMNITQGVNTPELARKHIFVVGKRYEYNKNE